MVEENQKMAQKIRSNEQQALKLQGAIETLEYILQPGEEVNEVTTEE